MIFFSFLKNIISKSSKHHRYFSRCVNNIIGPTLIKYNFTKHAESIEYYSSSITYRKNNQYVKISASTYPQDYPYTFDILLGEGDSEDFFEYDWNSISIWRLKCSTDEKLTAYNFIFSRKLKQDIEMANNDLIKFGKAFLEGDLSEYYTALKMKNKYKEPYRIVKSREEFLKSNNIFSEDF